MLCKLFSKLDSESQPSLRRFCNGRETTAFGAYPHGATITFRVEMPRSLGAAAVVMRLSADGEEPHDLPLTFFAQTNGTDIYTLTLQTSELCDVNGGLFFYELLFLRGLDTLFSDSTDNLHFQLCEHSENKFRLLIYRKDFQTPTWLQNGTMYHIFLDRFYRGCGEVALHTGAELNSDWEHGIPQFAKKAGDPLSNNVFFGGNLWGVIEKLDMLQSLGVTVLYLSPLFTAASNHRYDTADYETVDSYLGGDAALDALINEAHKRNMKIILDGVFNHTGDDSRYFNRKSGFSELGAYQSKRSRYYPWYSFRNYPDDYECWWGIEIMPRLNHDEPSCRRYFTAPNGIADKWLKRGIDGWRLDVADELPDSFLDELRSTVKQAGTREAAIIGEVWENAADKISYGKRRRYLCGEQLDSVMNYPFRNAILALLQRGDTELFVQILTEIYASYPPQVSHCLMNLLGTHDTERILTLLGDDGAGEGLSNTALSTLRLTPAQRARAIRLMKIASALQFTVYGLPSIYYGDEAGLEGYHDPFCRMPYPWGKEEPELLSHYRMLGELRRSHPALHGGDFRFLEHSKGYFLFERVGNGDRVLVGVNLSMVPITLSIGGNWKDLISGNPVHTHCTMPSGSCVLLIPADKDQK